MKRSRLKEVLRYDPKTGIFVWRNPTKFHPRMIGKQAGCISTGYRIIRIDGKKYKSYRLAWLYVYGVFPKAIDHADGDQLNDKIKNLRECSNSQNQANKKRMKGKKLPKGVKANGNKFLSRITFQKKQITIGTFSTVQEASDAYFEMSKKLYRKFARRD